MPNEMILGIVILTVMLLGGIWQRRNEKRAWNNGICAASGEPWRKFDCDSQGGHGYTDGVYYCWISYGVDAQIPAPSKPESITD
jgi:hypothetical protein